MKRCAYKGCIEQAEMMVLKQEETVAMKTYNRKTTMCKPIGRHRFCYFHRRFEKDHQGEYQPVDIWSGKEGRK